MHADTAHSPHAHWRSLPLGAVVVTGGFWERKQEINRQVTLRHGYRQLERAGNLNNLRLAAGRGEGAYRPPLFMDSDVYKWLEAAAYDLGNRRDPEVEAMADELIALLEAAQQEDGYLNSYYQVVAPERRWADLDHGHELYCAGHLFEAAVALHRTIGNTRLLAVARQVADHIDSVFGPGKREGAPGHPEIELALVEMYRETGERRYLELARFFVDQRGRGVMRGDRRHYGPEYHQDRVPVRQAEVVEGHAVRQLYLTAGVTDLYLETGEDALLEAMQRLWRDMTEHKMHVIGGFGARFTGEAFGQAYELPADRCYCETCAAIAAMMWNWRMLLATAEARYADLLERSLYNGFLSGVSLDGRRFFYVNPLQSRGGVERPEWYACACCPPNVMRQIAMIAHYAATGDDAGVQIHQYLTAVVRVPDAGGGRALRIETRYPWEGHVRVMVEEAGGDVWTLSLRIPPWAAGAWLAVEGQRLETPVPPGSYAEITRAWQPGDVVELHLPMAPRLTEPHPRVDAIRGSVCIERGPLVYCLEEADNDAGSGETALLDVRLPLGAPMQASWRDDLLDGVMVIEAEGALADAGDGGDALYRPASDTSPRLQPAQLRAIPYYAWANRGPGAMRVWLPREGE
jgi:uncharacterized protein